MRSGPNELGEEMTFCKGVIIKTSKEEPKLTQSGCAEDSVRVRCRMLVNPRETYAHCAKSKAHGPTECQPRHVRGKRVVTCHGHFGGRTAFVDDASEAERHRARSYTCRTPA